jgi:hypothetical protein
MELARAGNATNSALKTVAERDPPSAILREFSFIQTSPRDAFSRVAGWACSIPCPYNLIAVMTMDIAIDLLNCNTWTGIGGERLHVSFFGA